MSCETFSINICLLSFYNAEQPISSKTDLSQYTYNRKYARKYSVNSVAQSREEHGLTLEWINCNILINQLFTIDHHHWNHENVYHNAYANDCTTRCTRYSLLSLFYNKTPTSMTSLLNYLPCNLSLLGQSIMIVMMIFVTNRRFAMPKLIDHYKLTTVIL